MSVEPITLRVARDVWLNEDWPQWNNGGTDRLHMNGTAGSQRLALLYFGTPWPEDANILTGVLRLFSSKEWPATVTVTARRIVRNWAARRVHYANRPDTAGLDFSVTVNNIKQYDVIEIPVAGLLQAVANGAEYYGIEITVDAGGIDSAVYSQSGPGDYRPELEVSWADAPEAPEVLSPGGNRAVGEPLPTLTFDFTDVSGDTSLQAFRVQINATDDWAAPEYDTETDWPGGVPASVPEFDLSTSTYPALVAGVSKWWRVMVQDGAGIWSSWSEAEQFQYQPKLTATIDNPADAPNNFVEDPSPTVTWTVTGGTLRHWQLILTKPDQPSDWYWTTGKITGADTAFEIPLKEMPNLERTYRLILRVWDDVDRESTPGMPIFTHVQKDFTYNYDATVDPVTNLAVEQAYPWPWVDITWDRATMPDSFTILRDGDVLDKEDAETLFVSGTSYTYRDRRVNPRVDHTWKVVAHVNGKSSGNNPTLTAQTRPNTTWIMRPDSSDPICVVKSGDTPESVVTPALNSMQEVHQPVGGPPVLITQYLQGYEGHVSGTLADNLVPGLTGREMRDRFKGYMKDRGLKLLLYMVDETLEVVPYNMTYRPRAKSGGVVLYDIEFDFFEDS